MMSRTRVTLRLVQGVLVGLVLIVATGCATGRAVSRAESAIKRGDYDSAVAYYREALGHEPGRVDLRIALERTTRTASAEHLRRARELEAQDQLAGALAEYKLAADLDRTSIVAASKAAELEQRLRDLSAAARPQPRIDNLRQQAAQTSPIPRLDPRVQVPEMHFTTASVRQLLSSISALTGINVTYDQSPALDQALSRPYPIDVQQTSLEDLLNQILTANGMTFKVLNTQTIFVYQDNAANRLKYEDQYIQTFYISNVDAQELLALITQMLAQGPAVTPRIQVNKTSNTLVVRATAPILQLIENVVRANDRPRPEVMIEAEILEVDRAFTRQLGLDLNQYALGFTFSPELAPPNTTSLPGTFPSGPPPFNLNTLSQGISAQDFYVTSPTALIRILESNTTTKVLAKPSMQGRDGQPMSLNLGDSVPIPQTAFQSAAPGGAATIPTTSVTYQSVGVNLLFTPRVTYRDEIILDNFRLEKSGLGNFLLVAGQSFPTIVQRVATGSLRLRDGESSLIAGLLRDDDRKTLKSFPGFTGIPILRSLFGNSDSQVEQTDLVMILTPHIVRTHELSAEDLKPLYVGTSQNFGGGTAPTLIAPEAIGVGDGAAPAPGGAAPGPGAAPVQAQPAPPAAPGAGVQVPVTPANRAPGVVPIEAVPSTPAAPPAATSVRITMTAPTAPGDGGLLSGSGPHTVPITISGAPALSAITLTVTYNPAILRTPTVTQGSFMSQGGVTATFVPRVDANTGRIDIVLTRPVGATGAATAGLLAAIAFTAGTPGTTDLTITGVATAATGQSVPVEFNTIRMTVR